LGAVPAAHRTDQLTAAVSQLPDREVFTQRYQGLLAHYGLAGQKTQAGHANENGDVEQRHHRFKEAVDQALMLRGSRDFDSRAAYEQFLRDLLSQLDAGRQERLAEELAVMRPLPESPRASYKDVRGVRVDRGSLIHVDRNAYSVHSRLIHEKVDVRVYADHLEVRYAQTKVEVLPRLRGRGKSRINYRHVIDWLIRKPGAFANYRYREELFPTSRFRMAYDVLCEQSAQGAAKEYLAILYLAAYESESAVDAALGRLLEGDEPLTARAVRRLVAAGQRIPPVTEVTVAPVDPSVFDELYSEQEAA